MNKIRLTFTIEFEPKKEWYADGTTFAEMMAIEKKNAENNPIGALNNDEEIKVEAVEVGG